MFSFIRDTIRFWKIRKFQQEIWKWQDEKFPQKTPYSIAHHLGREANEFCEAVATDTKERASSELADVTLLFWGLDHECRRKGFLDPFECAKEKFYGELIYRKWGKPDEHGVSEHIKDRQEGE